MKVCVTVLHTHCSAVLEMLWALGCSPPHVASLQSTKRSVSSPRDAQQHNGQTMFCLKLCHFTQLSLPNIGPKLFATMMETCKCCCSLWSDVSHLGGEQEHPEEQTGRRTKVRWGEDAVQFGPNPPTIQLTNWPPILLTNHPTDRLIKQPTQYLNDRLTDQLTSQTKKLTNQLTAQPTN